MLPLTEMLCYSLLILKVGYNHGQKAWDTFAFLGCFPVHTGPTPPLTPQTMLDACIQNFSECQLCIGWGNGRGGGWMENCKKISKRMHCLTGKGELTEKYECCSTVPRTFVQDRLNPGFWGEKSVFFFFPTFF